MLVTTSAAASPVHGMRIGGARILKSRHLFGEDRMRTIMGLLALAAFAAQAQTPPAFPARNVQATFFGTVVDDPYRDLEDIKNPDVVAWAKSHADFARSQLESLPGYKGLRSRVTELDESATATVGTVRLDGKGNLFFTRRGARDNTLKLYQRDAKG